MAMMGNAASLFVSRVQGKVSLISSAGVHQLHIFIFVLAVFHIVYSVATMALGRLKVSTQAQAS